MKAGVIAVLLSFSPVAGHAQEGESRLHIQGPDSRSRARVQGVLNALSLTQRGRALIEVLEGRPHRVTIEDDRSESARNSTGVTIAFVDADMSNGVGVPSTVHIDFSFPDSGSHCVVGQEGRWISFPTVVNLHHELAHASHYSTGRYRHPQRISSEYRAIAAENELREELGLPLRNPFDARGDWASNHPGGCAGEVPPEELAAFEGEVATLLSGRL